MKSAGTKSQPGIRENQYPVARPSTSADASLRAEIGRVGKMTIEERIRTALSLGKKFKASQTPTKEQ